MFWSRLEKPIDKSSLLAKNADVISLENRVMNRILKNKKDLELKGKKIIILPIPDGMIQYLYYLNFIH